jgi:hypothetical protein
MDKSLKDLLYDLWGTIVAYLPNVLAGLLLLLIGCLAGWVVKRVVIQLLALLRFERLLTRFRARSALAKADIRYALYNFIGNIAFAIVFLVFLDFALGALKLAALSKLIETGVLFIPRLTGALAIFGIGFLIAARSAAAIQHALMKEKFPNPALVSGFAKSLIILFFSAMALIELKIATIIVTIGFTALTVTLCIILLVIVLPLRESLRDLFKPDDK